MNRSKLNKSFLTNIIETAGIVTVSVAGSLAFAALVTAPINYLINSKTRELPNAKIISKAHFPIGHTDLIIYQDGSREMIEFTGIGQRIGRTNIYTDKDGDGDIDFIKEFASGYKFNRILSYIDAEKEYIANKKRIDAVNELYQDFLRNNYK